MNEFDTAFASLPIWHYRKCETGRSLFHERLCRIVSRLGHKPSTLAPRCGVHHALLLEWLSGERRPGIAGLRSLSEGLDTSIHFLLCGRDYPEVEIEAFDARLRRLCAAKSLDALDIARACGSSKSCDGAKPWLSGRRLPGAVALPELSRLLGVSIHYLLTGTHWRGGPAQDFGTRLHTLMRTRPITLEALAERLRETQEHVEQWIAGRPEPDHETLLRLCRVLGCSVDFLATGTPWSDLAVAA